MKKRTISVLLAGLALLVPAAGCTANNSASSQNSTEEIAGGWSVNTGDPDPDQNAEAKAAFEKAVENLDGYEYQPIAYLGSQIVSGTNYAWLCQGQAVTPDAQKEYDIVYVYEDLDGNTTIYASEELLDVNEGWSYQQGESSLDQNTEVKKAFEEATEGLTGASYEPVAYVGSQTVTGNTYAVFCRKTLSDQNGDQSFCLVTIHVDTDGKAELGDINDIDLSVDSDNSASIANPFTEVSTLDEAARITGFSLTIPDASSDYPEQIIQVMDSDMIEVIYKNGDEEGYRIRKEAGSEDISGDYNEYGEVKTVQVHNKNVTEKGNGELISTATWTEDGYTYAIDAEDHPLTNEELTDIVNAVK